jgi:hypothetical protein
LKRAQDILRGAIVSSSEIVCQGTTPRTSPLSSSHIEYRKKKTWERLIQSTNRSIDQRTNQSINQSINQTYTY